ncbi:conserved hypothetical protein [Lebetimonas natsushimae]|uniref:Uncharacterized protein n=1 Tax=Lebetimonas natsushimae TaxID=1936991 RepID=A0A292YCB9_9BACT|nr:hypothetical protein [Lebetimonas natsushimae]GAX87146.1 conserved hypothetical protein [Lebetimonas natsushimae]
MNIFKILVSAVILVSFSYAINPYTKGYRAYIRYIKHAGGHTLKAPQLLKKLDVNTPDQLNALFTDNAKPLLEKLNKLNPKAAKGLQKIIEKGELPYLKVFFTKILEGKIPPG